MLFDLVANADALKRSWSNTPLRLAHRFSTCI